MKERNKTPKGGIPYSTIVRLTQYLRVIERLDSIGVTTISSQELADEAKVNSFLVRKDFSYFGEFGTRGVGYEVANLKRELRKVLGLTRPRKAVLVGAGNLGSALMRYPGFIEKGFHIIGVFDSDPEKIGKHLWGHDIFSIFQLDKFMDDNPDIEIGIMTVPNFSAQYVANLLVAHGIKGILNFAPLPLEIPENVVNVSVDLTTHLEVISYYISRR
jgi:redox-sensing transcriptional repressor